MSNPNKKYLIAIVGRPNVGKSTLFNRLTGKWQAIVEDRPGITRDRLYGDFSVYNHRFQIMDTGGLNLDPKTRIEKKMSAQAEKGIAEADLILFIMDGRAGATTLDQEWVAKLRKVRKPKLFIVNKIDEAKMESKAQEFYELGINPLVLISAEKQRNFRGLSEAILDALKLDKDTVFETAKPNPDREIFDQLQKEIDRDDVETTQKVPDDEEVSDDGAAEVTQKIDDDDEITQKIPDDEAESALPVSKRPLGPTNIAIIGRPNVGKSTLLNAILDEERSIVDDSPGTTRDPIHTYIEHDGQEYCIIDTAGIRKRAKTVERVEKFSVVNALSVIDQAHIVLLVMDGGIGPTEQDAHVAGYAFEKQKGIVVVVNKWDEGSKTFSREQFKEKLELKLNYLNYCPLIFISAKTRKNLPHVFKAVEQVQKQYDVMIKTSELNRAFEYIVDHHPLPTHRGRDIKMFYATQIGYRPPSFMVFCSQPEHVHFTYKRYLINAIRETFGLENVPVRLIFRKR